MEGKRVSNSRVVIAQVMLPTDANPKGNVHGGVIMRLVDTAGAIVAAKHARRPVVTVVIDSMTFLSPIFVGDLVTLEGTLQWVGHTSMEVYVKVEAEDVRTGRKTHTSSAYAVYVALDEQGQPTPVPPLILETEEEKRRWAEAEQRRAIRLQLKKQQQER